ncbi:MAG: endolytic transglycosylase MltG [Oscillospiraceae bacterium]|nr:endolytic transglycosylase MltG [Oscillospiraceae bacterium]
MENKEFPELEPQDLIPAEEAVMSDTPAAETTGFVDYFADILPEQTAQQDIPAEEAPAAQIPAEEAPLEEPSVEEFPAQEEAIAADMPVLETAPVPEETPTADTIVLTEIQAAVESIINREESVPVEITAPQDAEVPQEPAAQEEPSAAEESAEAPKPVRKGRPKRRKGEFLFGIPQIAVTCVWLAIILVTGLTLGRMLWVCAADVLAFGREDKMVTVTVYESDSMEDIIEKLHKAELIRYPGLFKLYADLAVDEGEIKPGIWDLNTMYDYHALVNMMSPSSSRTVIEDVLIPEGFTCRQIFDLLEEKRVCTAKDLAEYAASGELKEYWFLENVERGYEYCLEGFLFPDTYDFYKNSNPRDVLEKLLDNFEFRFTEEMRGQMDTLNANVTGGTFDIHKLVIVASMIEKETAANEESPKIASVIYNRLFRWGGTPAYLNIDASIVYALDGKTDLTAEDLKVESPYNTYTNTGLTPGAIANPGLASLKAALNPENTNYYFYVLNPAEGRHKFSTSLDEHNAFIASLE